MSREPLAQLETELAGRLAAMAYAPPDVHQAAASQVAESGSQTGHRCRAVRRPGRAHCRRAPVWPA